MKSRKRLMNKNYKLLKLVMEEEYYFIKKNKLFKQVILLGL